MRDVGRFADDSAITRKQPSALQNPLLRRLHGPLKEQYKTTDVPRSNSRAGMKFLPLDFKLVLIKYSVELSRAAAREFDAECHRSILCRKGSAITLSGAATASFVGVSIT
jgi:hypothetical protein